MYYICRMDDLEFWGVFGEQRLKVKVFRPQGGGRIQVFVDNYLEGTMDKVNGTWVFDVPRKGILTSVDILMLSEMLDGEVQEI